MSRPLHPPPSSCPVCSAPTFIEKVRCSECGTAVEGHFANDWMQALTREQLAFIKVFVSCRGKIKDVEEALGISYPTVVSRLEEVASAIASPGAAHRHHHHGRDDREGRTDRKKVLDDLASGAIDAEEAARRLRRR